MADFRSVVSYGLFGSAIKSSVIEARNILNQLYLYVFFQISTRTTQEWNLNIFQIRTEHYKALVASPQTDH